jgi:PKD repeat protein
VFSPSEPLEDSAVLFNAGESTAATGRRIASYRWNWGDGTASGSGVARAHTFANPGTYIVMLTVTDDVGQTATATREVTVCPSGGCI